MKRADRSAVRNSKYSKHHVATPLPSRSGEQSSLTVGWCSDFLPPPPPGRGETVQGREKGNSHFSVEKPDKHDLRQVRKVSIDSDQTPGKPTPS